MCIVTFQKRKLKGPIWILYYFSATNYNSKQDYKGVRFNIVYYILLKQKNLFIEEN